MKGLPLSNVIFDPLSGRVAFPDTPFDSGVVEFQLADRLVRSNELDWEGSGHVFAAEAEGIVFRVTTRSGFLSAEVTNRSKRDVTLDEIRVRFAPEDMNEPLECARFLEMISHLICSPRAGVKKVGLASRDVPRNPEASLVYALRDTEGGASYLFAATGPQQGDYTWFRALHDSAHMEGRFGVLIRSEQRRLLKRGRKGAMTAVQLKVGDDPLELLRDFGSDLAAYRREPLKDRRVGFNTWDYYAGAATSQDVYDNQEVARRRFGDQVRDYVIDLGWERCWGCWEANHRYPEGLARFCKKIKAKGGTPGVWTAPLGVQVCTQLFRYHPDWFCRDAKGQIIPGNLGFKDSGVLDVTHPEVEAWLEQLYRRLREAGFEYFKVDFTLQAMQAGAFHDPTVPRGEIIRRVFEIVRRAIGPEAYLLACGAPYQSVLGVVDAIRVTPDVNNRWAHIRANCGAIATMWWSHRKLWNVDPDFLIVRCPETSPDPLLSRPMRDRPLFNPVDVEDYWHSGRQANLNEMRCWALLARLSAGDIMVGDDMTKLNDLGIETLRKVIEQPLTAAAVPLDLFDSHDGLPSLWLAEECDQFFLGIFNWEEDPLEFDIDIEELDIRNWERIELFWEDETIEPDAGVVSLRLPPRSCQGLRIIKRRPAKD